LCRRFEKEIEGFMPNFPKKSFLISQKHYFEQSHESIQNCRVGNNVAHQNTISTVKILIL